MQLGPGAEGRPANITRCLLIVLSVIPPNAQTALLDHQPLLVNTVLLTVRYPPVPDHVHVLGKLLPAVRAARGATERRVVRPHVNRQVRLGARQMSAMSAHHPVLIIGFRFMFLLEVFHCFFSVGKFMRAKWASCPFQIMLFKGVNFKVIISRI